MGISEVCTSIGEFANIDDMLSFLSELICDIEGLCPDACGAPLFVLNIVLRNSLVLRLFFDLKWAFASSMTPPDLDDVGVCSCIPVGAG